MDQLQQEIISSIYNSGYANGYNKAIDDYKKEMIEFLQGDEEFTEWQKREMLELNEIVAGQLKAGANNETDN